MSETLEERLRNHSESFNGLLSLIPSKYYYDEDTAEQWKKKKQTKKESKSAKRAKFDPDKVSTALEANKIKEQQAKEKGPESFSAPKPKSAEKASESELYNSLENEFGKEVSDEEVEIDVQFDDKGNEMPLQGSAATKSQEAKTNLTTDKSINKISERVGENTSKEPIKEAKETPKDANKLQELRAKLHSKINELKEMRKAPGTSIKGAPLNREAILEARRVKKEALKKRKQEKILQERSKGAEVEEDDNNQTESQAITEDNDASSLLFSHVVFKDGQKTSTDSTYLEETKKRKTRDIEGQLNHIKMKKAKIDALDEEKREEVETKSHWSKAILQSRGERVKDDPKLLAKAAMKIKKGKKKSELQWKEREEAVAKSFRMKDQKREENLAKRKDLKSNKGKKKKPQKKRVGFEGRSGKSSKPGKPHGKPSGKPSGKPNGKPSR